MGKIDFNNWFSGKTALVTGATSGIGREIAKELVDYGAKVLACGRDKKAMNYLLQELDSLPSSSAAGFIGDLSEKGFLQGLISEIRGNYNVDILVNNAGFGYLNDDFYNMPVDKIEEMKSVNLSSVVQLCRAFVPGMIERSCGGILNVGSTASFFATPGSALYGATKHFILGFTDALHQELLSRSVHVSGIYPGHTLTRFAERATDGKIRNWRKAMSPRMVAKLALSGLAKNKIRVIPGFYNKITVISSFVLPQRIILRKIYNTANKNRKG